LRDEMALDREALVRATMTLAAEAGARGDPPFGALLVDPDGAVVARGSNCQVSVATRRLIPRSSCCAGPLRSAIERPFGAARSSSTPSHARCARRRS